MDNANNVMDQFGGSIKQYSKKFPLKNTIRKTIHTSPPPNRGNVVSEQVTMSKW